MAQAGSCREVSFLALPAAISPQLLRLAGTGPAAAGSTSVGPAASTGSSGGTGPAGVAGSASAGPAASTGSGAGGFGPYSQEQVEQFVKQLKHMDMLGIDTYVTCSGEIFDREELRQVIKRFDR